MNEDFHLRDKFVEIVNCPSEFISLPSTTHQCRLARYHECEHECSCGKKWRTVHTGSFPKPERGVNP